MCSPACAQALDDLTARVPPAHVALIRGQCGAGETRDFMLLRFLRARSFDVSAAAEMITSTAEWCAAPVAF